MGWLSAKMVEAGSEGTLLAKEALDLSSAC